MAPVAKNPPANAGDRRDVGLIPGSGSSPGWGNGNPLQHSFLENPIDRGALWVTVHWVANSWTQLKQLSTYHHTVNYWWRLSIEKWTNLPGISSSLTINNFKESSPSTNCPTEYNPGRIIKKNYRTSLHSSVLLVIWFVLNVYMEGTK